jgi:hypothetical protein
MSKTGKRDARTKGDRVSALPSAYSANDTALLLSQLIAEVRVVENLLASMKGDTRNLVIAPKRYRKFKHRITGAKLCSHKLDPGPGWQRICLDQTWASRAACSRAICPDD